MAVRYFALIIGLVYALVGILGFFPGVRHDMGTGAPDLAVDSQYGLLLGLFPINILHNIVHLLIGVWGISAYSGYGAAKTFSKGLAIIYGLLAIMGLIPGLNTLFGLVPLYGNDVRLHAATAIVAPYFGWGTPAREPTTRAR